jgi:putative addiction module CopG family antidote
MNVSLTPMLEAFIRRQVASGLYNNASEVVREALRYRFRHEGAGAGAPPAAKDDLRVKLAALEKPLRERGVLSLALFGSFVRGQARADSDIDVLVDIDPNAHFGLTDLVSLQHFLEERLERKVDVVTRQGIEPAIRDNVLREAEGIF